MGEALEAALHEMRQVVREEMNKPRAAQVSEESEYFTVAEASVFAKCSKATVRKWVNGGKLRRYGEHGGLMLIRKDELRTFLSREPKRKASSSEETADEMMSRAGR